MLGRMDRDLAGAFPAGCRGGHRRLQQLGLLVQHRSGSFSFRNAMLARGRGPRGSARRWPPACTARPWTSTAPPPWPRRCAPARLAWHAARAGERQEAAGAYLSLAESARERHSYLEADLLYTQALSQLDDPSRSRPAAALKGRGTMRYRLGRYEGSREDLARARELAARGGDPVTQADVMLDEAMALDWLFEWRRSRELAERARELVAGPGAPALQARVLLALGRSLIGSTRTRRRWSCCARPPSGRGDRATRVTRCR